MAAGADGLMIEVHEDPEHAVSDGAQTITPAGFQATDGPVPAHRPGRGPDDVIGDFIDLAFPVLDACLGDRATMSRRDTAEGHKLQCMEIWGGIEPVRGASRRRAWTCGCSVSPIKGTLKGEMSITLHSAEAG